MPEIGADDAFEQAYTAKLRGILVGRGVLVDYDVDRAAIDLGVHLWVDVDGKKDVSGARIWFQAKGFHDTTVTVGEYDKSDAITSPSLTIDHVQYWYNAPEPVYLTIYVESIDTFLAADVRDLVDRRGGLAKLIGTGQSTVTLKIPKTETLQHALEHMPQHRSMRIDGPAWRGRPLGHGIDPLRSVLSPMAPELFIDVVAGLLEAHGFRPVDREGSLKDIRRADEPTVLAGRLYLTYEWVLPMTTEFGYDRGSDFRIEGAPLHAQGDVLVVVDPTGSATPESIDGDLSAIAEAADIRQVLVMSNGHHSAAQFGSWLGGLRSAGLSCHPQDLGSLTFNVLTTTNVFLEFHTRLDYSFINYL